MAWIKTISFDKADSVLKRIYKRVVGPNNNVDNVLSIHSLRPHTLVGHMTLYKSVLHNSNNTLPKWYLESLGVYVSQLNNCSYCVKHHFAGFERLLDDTVMSKQYWEAVQSDDLSSFFDVKYLKGAEYAKLLTVDLSSIREQHITDLKTVGFTEGEILEINQVTSYFCYVNRMVVGLGVDLKGDVLGLSPNDSEDANDWGHS
jgi:uncharacterized peroxidase-related enzyme